MFCEQCEQTASGNGCHQWGACGKSPEVNAVQDLSMYVLRGLAPVALRARELGISTTEVDRFTCEAIFATMTNVNFDRDRFSNDIRRAIAYREDIKAQIQQAGAPETWLPISCYEPDYNESLVSQGQEISLQFLSQGQGNVDIFSLKLTVLYGIKGVASYAFHAMEMGQEDGAVYQFIYEALAALERQNITLNGWVAIALKVGEINLRTMELLDAGHTSTYGHPTPTPVPLNHKTGKAILVSGHDIPQLEAILTQTVGKGITVYTHGELLPAHGYPRLKETYPHLHGHYGTAWQNQTKDFAKFPGAIIITTNCLMPPHDNYEHKLFSVGPVGYPGLNAIPMGADGHPDFTPAINKALELPGFTEEDAPRQVMTGFARNAVLGVADKVIEAVKAGQIRHFFLVGGCDGAKPDRNYYTEFVEKVPEDCIVLTLACGKFRFFDKDLGNIGGIPRLLDVGQCNDAYSAIQIAIALANAFGVGVNELPLSMILSWYEQKAVAVLLTLLYLGIQDIRLGPTLPAFISPNVMSLLSQTYKLKPIATPDEDLAACLAKG
ncbi:hydroxylamine reductase [Oscillatoria sp. FACHB-1406]|uniref:hydroxylamine reductase n=1 Tax=Oscillatoria sp. FACHB-1406 TaxID=2692846 RepID=UPI001685C402|nr:hydroxylamine reductase [Oscillatoria sp. FACHB-1406]MBD2576298.1 hydroxylamine reductase [Oscillatoria sp. FACHB-1406]